MVRKPQYPPLQQVVRRLRERSNCADVKHSKLPPNNVPVIENFGPVPDNLSNVPQFKKIYWRGFFLSVLKGDNCVKIGDSLFLIRNILAPANSDGNLVVERFTSVMDFFKYPLSSNELGIQEMYMLSVYKHRLSSSDVTRS
eukprot:TRINITY_DN132388_c0_g1_i1.p1 TRINITY_DN132388_c0_g1~~TRINITY_DN132388_c0_g1_i1.p1  ORF type:complete len:141 (+),score=9.99 TRINITY_DN132388_c0_g1_i1:122-544(+)